MLSVVIFAPLVLSLPLFFLRGRKTWFGYTWFASVVVFVLSLALLRGFQWETPGFQWEQQVEWLPTLGASYHIGIDGLSLILILLTTFLPTISILASFRYIQHRIREFCIAMLVLEGAMIGVFASLDLLLFFIFWEVMLVPMFLLIGVWGHDRRIYAAFKFVLYTMAGSAFLLFAILVLRLKTGTFDLVTLQQTVGNLPGAIQRWAFLAFAIAFAIKVPLVPFHTWLPDAHVEAPTAGSVLLAGILLKMGIYGFLRFNFALFPSIARDLAPLFMALGVIGILYGAWMSWVQTDLKKLIAYSSVAHLGFVILGIFTFTPWGLQGGILQMVNHGLSTGALFLAAGLLYERKHTREMSQLVGIGKLMPVFSTMFGIVMLSSIGLPGLNGFVGEFLILLGTFQVSKTLAFFGVLGIIFAAVYMLSMFQKVVFLPPREEDRGLLKDLTLREWVVFVPLLVFIFAIGVYPRPFLKFGKVPSQQVIERVAPEPPTPTLSPHAEEGEP